MSDSSEWFQPDKSSPEYQVLEVLDKIGLSRELFTRYSGERARRIGDAILKAVASELHPDKNNGIEVEQNGVDIREINLARSLLSSTELNLESLAVDDNFRTLEVEDLKDSIDAMHHRNRGLSSVNSELFKSLMKAKEHEPLDNKLSGAMLIIKENEIIDNLNDSVDVSNSIIVTFDDKGLVKNISKNFEKFEQIQRVLIKKIDEDFAQEILKHFYVKNSNKKYELKKEVNNTDLIIINGKLFGRKSGNEYEFTGIEIEAKTDEQKEQLEVISNIPLGLTLARPKGQTDADIKKKGDVVTPVFNYFEPDNYVEKDIKKKPVPLAKGARFIGYITVSSKSGDAKSDYKTRQALKISPNLGGTKGEFKGVVGVDAEAMNSLISQAVQFSGDAADLKTVKKGNTQYEYDYTLMVLYKKDSKGNGTYYLLSGPASVILPNKE